jgi:transposase-like protein
MLSVIYITSDSGQFLDKLGANRSHVAIHNWVYKVDPQPISTVTVDQFPADKKVIRVNGSDYWLYGAVDPESNRIYQFRLLRQRQNR